VEKQVIFQEIVQIQETEIASPNILIQTRIRIVFHVSNVEDVDILQEIAQVRLVTRLIEVEVPTFATDAASLVIGQEIVFHLVLQKKGM